MYDFGRFLKVALDTVLPPLCHLCKASIPDTREELLCDHCLEKCYRIQSPLCLVCGIPFLTSQGIDHVCGRCQTAPPPFRAARAAFLYEASVKELIHRFKYGHKVLLAHPIGCFIARYLSEFVVEVEPDLLMPIPLHRTRLRERCFNQAQLLGEVLAKMWDIPLSIGNLQRVRQTVPQTNLTADERARNVRGAFAMSEPAQIQGKRVLLVDDVLTTGSTVAECSRVLHAGGAEAVCVVTACRAGS